MPFVEQPNQAIRPILAFNLFQRFATTELTHSGVWGWILQSLDDTAPPPMHELRPAARALIARVGIADFTSPVSVVRERRLPGTAGRVDIEVTDGRGRVAVFETKVQARPDLIQRQRYEDCYRAEGRDLAAVAILSTTHDDPWMENPPPYIGADGLLEVLYAGRYKSDLMTQYVAWLEHLVRSRREALARALGEAADAASEALESAAAQWGVMRQLGVAVGGPGVCRLYCGQNKDGSPWTQLLFCEGRPPAFDALFYRLESWRGKPAQFTLRQYQKPADVEKPVRLQALRALFREASVGSSVPFDTEPRGARTRAQEAKIAQVTIPPVTMGVVLTDLPGVHARFRSRLAVLGWPLGVGALG